MALIPRKKTGSNVVPLSAEMTVGEITSNVADGKMFLKKTDGTIVEIGAGSGLNEDEVLDLITEWGC